MFDRLAVNVHHCLDNRLYGSASNLENGPRTAA